MDVNLISEWMYENCGFKLRFYYNPLKRFYCRVLGDKDEQILPTFNESQIFLESPTALLKLNKLSSTEKFDILVNSPMRKARVSRDGLYLAV